MEGGRFAVGFIFAGSFAVLAYRASELMQKLDVTKVDAQVVVIAIVTGTITIASSVASFYFAQRR